MKHELALDRLSMTYSWYNIRSDHKNNTIKYTPEKRGFMANNNFYRYIH